ncbi:hypothetical protein [Pedobacter boryungensis]|uniref:Uncharacterized protein n=1 Tax=Pedobacter boryungensis TaxID=869962 RepID=A0ABX2DDX4_9SPHI|nr:hypothetical protein [Pedobacter boryungensis]NQX31643.1 hypothetical protein [Pedobacter boryungensis]
MSVPSYISSATVAEEIEACQENCKDFNWLISPLDEVNQLFTVSMVSPIDQKEFIIEFRFDNYPETPYLIDFVSPENKQVGEFSSYPLYQGDSFFNRVAQGGVICHPCSRKAYAGYSGIHSDWQLVNWRAIAGGLINLNAILDTIYTRISNKTWYRGKMV